MNDSIPYSVKVILKNYDIEINSFANYKRSLKHISITVRVLFIPKEISVVTPVTVAALGAWIYYKDHKKFYDIILPHDKNMPILKYVDNDNSFEDFLMDIIEKSADEKFEEVKSEFKF